MRTINVSIHVLLFLAMVSGCSDDVAGHPPDRPEITAVKSCVPPCWQESYQSVRPAKRYFHGMAYDEQRRVTVLFGGKHQNGEKLDDTWEFNGSWHKIRTPIKPSARWKPAMCYSPVMKCVILFGGGSNQFFNDTWKFDGLTWTKIQTAHSPQRRVNATMVHDYNSGKIVLFGGESPSDTHPYFSTTWFFDGQDWTEMDLTASGLYGREGCKMVYDLGRQRAVLYGGMAGVIYYNTTWEFYDQTWHQVSTEHNPGNIAYYAMAYDDSTGRTVISCGGAFGGYSDKTWEFDGNDWTLITTDMHPPASMAHSMVYDRRLKHMVMFTGAGPSGIKYDQTWFYWGENTATEAPAITPTTAVVLLLSLPLLILIRTGPSFNRHQNGGPSQ